MSGDICRVDKENWMASVAGVHFSREREVQSDLQLVVEAQHGDAGAFDELCQRHRSMILRVAQRITRDQRDAQDAVQDALLSAYLGLPRFNGQSKFHTWLTRIVINSSLMTLRKRQAHRNIPKFTESLERLNETGWEVADTASDPEKVLLGAERERLVRESIRALPHRLRTVAELSHVHERSSREIAAELGISVSATKTRLFRANSLLRRRRPLRGIACSRLSPISKIVPVDCQRGECLGSPALCN
jgi:RNA polymerase sigma-70 factor, ECF subfamily